MKCGYHADKNAVGACVNCGQLICVECKTVLGEKIYCNPCVDKMFPSVDETSLTKPAIARREMENTSGQGSTVPIPPEIRGWNWGAFLLNWIWGIGNSVWIALLCLLPFVGFVMIFVLGAKGNEWAWQSKKWDSIEHFKRTQRNWVWWGLGIWGSVIALYIIMIIAAVAAD